MRTLTYSLLFFVIAATVGLGWLFDQLYNQYQATEQNQNTDAVNVLEQLGAELAMTLNDLNNRDEFILNWQKKTSSSVHISTGKAKLNYNLELEPVSEVPLPKALLKEVRHGNSLLLETNNGLAFYYYLPANEELLILKSPMLTLKDSEQSINYVFTLLFYLALLVLFIIWVYPLIRQLHQLRKAAKLFGQGQLQQRIKHSRLPYLKDIEVEFNHMAQRIEDLIADVKLLSSAVSHDLRTPLARIRFGIDTLQEEDDPELRKRFEQKISDNVDEMTSLVETLLTYSRLDQTMLNLEKEPINLSQLVKHCAQPFSNESNHIKTNLPKHDVFINADKRYISILINNLLQNASNYGDGEILISVFITHDVIQLVVEDNGQGISNESMEKIFLPFMRGDDRKNQIKGHGIGLAIVKRIVDWHKGTISVGTSHQLHGAKFTVSFPKTFL